MTSYHLRTLAAAGLVEEEPDRGTARDRWWRAAHDLASFPPRGRRGACRRARGSVVRCARDAAHRVDAVLAAFVGVYMLDAVRSIAKTEALHDRMPSERRTTMVSLQSLAQQIGNVVASPVLTRVAAAAGIPVAWIIGAVLMLLAAAAVLATIDDR